MLTDSSGNVFITGTRQLGTIIYGSEDYDIITVKYNKEGNLIWTAQYNGNGSSLESTERMQLDKNGNVYVTGFTDKLPLGESNQEWVTIKYNSNGVQEWAKTFDTVGSVYDADVAHGLAVDNSGNVYVTGESIGAFTIKYNSAGDRQWVAGLPAYGTGEEVVVDKEGDVLVSATVYNSQNLYEFVLIKYNSAGIKLWRKYIGKNGCLACK